MFQEPSTSPEPEPDILQGSSAFMKHEQSLGVHLNGLSHRNKVTRTNPLFDPQLCDNDTGDDKSSSEFGMEKLKNDKKHLYHPDTMSQKQDSSARDLIKSDSWRDQSKEMSTRKGGELANFTITTYQRPQDTDGLLSGDSSNNWAQSVQEMSTDPSKKSTTAVARQKYSSTSSLNSSGPLGSVASVSRTNSFSNNDSGTFKLPGPVKASSVKRSTSYISLVANPGNGFQSGRTYTPYTSRTKSVGNLAAEAHMDAEDERGDENWDLRNATSKHSVSQDPADSIQEGNKPQTTAEEQKARESQVGQEEPRGSQQQIIMTEEERAQLLELQKQFLQLQEQLLQNAGLMQQQRLSQPQAAAADTPLQSLQVRNTPMDT